MRCFNLLTFYSRCPHESNWGAAVCTKPFFYRRFRGCAGRTGYCKTPCYSCHRTEAFDVTFAASHPTTSKRRVCLEPAAFMPLLKIYILIQNCIFRNDRIVATHIGKRTAQFGTGIRSSLLRGDIRTLLVVYRIVFYGTNFKQIAADCFLSKLCSNCCVAFTNGRLILDNAVGIV